MKIPGAILIGAAIGVVIGLLLFPYMMAEVTEVYIFQVGEYRLLGGVVGGILGSLVGWLVVREQPSRHS